MGRFPWWHEGRDARDPVVKDNTLIDEGRRRGTTAGNYPYDDPNIAKKGCATCGHKFRSGEERSVELATGRQICDKCQYTAEANQGIPMRAGDAPQEERMQLSTIKALYGIETERRFMRDDDTWENTGRTHKTGKRKGEPVRRLVQGDEYIGERVIERKPFLRELFTNEQNAPPEWLQQKREKKREEEERSHDTVRERRRRGRYSRTHGTMPRGTPE